MKAYPLVNGLLYNVVWAACVVGAGRGNPWLGAALAVPLAAFHLKMTASPEREARFMATAVAAGLLMDTAHSLAGTFTFRPDQSLAGMPPLWLVGVWIAFSTTFRGCLGFLRGRYIAMAAIGAFGGPLAYLAGWKFGAVTMPADRGPSTAALIIAWAVAFPALGWLSAKMSPPPTQRSEA